MKQQINLMPPTTKINLGILSLKRVLLIIFVVITALIIFNIILWFCYKKIEKDNVQLDVALNEKKVFLQKTIINENKINDSFKQEIETMMLNNKNTQSKLNAFDKLFTNRAHGYSVFLAVVLDQVSGCKINSLSFDVKKNIMVTGSITHPEILNQIIQQWSESEALHNQSFRVITIEQQEDESWHFMIGNTIDEAL